MTESNGHTPHPSIDDEFAAMREQDVEAKTDTVKICLAAAMRIDRQFMRPGSEYETQVIAFVVPLNENGDEVEDLESANKAAKLHLPVFTPPALIQIASFLSGELERLGEYPRVEQMWAEAREYFGQDIDAYFGMTQQGSIDGDSDMS